jgi:hypothetical protein
MEMKRRDFVKYFFILSAVGTLAGLSYDYTINKVRSFRLADKIKKFPGRIKPLGEEIGSEGKWNG